MKHLVGCLEAGPLSGAVIQSVSDHSQLLIRDDFHAPLLEIVLAQQSIEVFVTAALPAAIRISKMGLYPQGLIDGLLVRKLLATVKDFTRDFRGLIFCSMAWLRISAVLWPPWPTHQIAAQDRTPHQCRP